MTPRNKQIFEHCQTLTYLSYYEANPFKRFVHAKENHPASCLLNFPRCGISISRENRAPSAGKTATGTNVIRQISMPQFDTLLVYITYGRNCFIVIPYHNSNTLLAYRCMGRNSCGGLWVKNVCVCVYVDFAESARRFAVEIFEM